MTEKPDMAELARALDDAAEHYRTMEARASHARSEATDALNELNRAQKAFDAGVAAHRAAAPMGSDWARSRIREVVES